MAETQDILDKPVGTRESVKLEAGSFPVVTVTKEAVKRKTGELIGEKVVLSIKHPASQELIGLSSALYLKDRSIKQSALWVNEDPDGNIPKKSALAEVMAYYKVASAKQFEGKTISTQLDEKGYLVIKAY